MAWVAVNKNNRECIYEKKPKRCYCSIWALDSLLGSVVELPKGSIKKLIGRELSWKDEPVELSSSIKTDNMAKYKVGDIFINHTDGKILQVCEGGCNECCRYRFSTCKGLFDKNVSCKDFIGHHNLVEELPFLPPGTKVKIREDLKVGTQYGQYVFVSNMWRNKEVTIERYFSSSKAYGIIENGYLYALEMFDQVINEPKENNNMETKEIKIKVPEGYEIDEENSALDCIKFKPIKKELTYKDVAEKLFDDIYYFTDRRGEIDSARQLNVKEDKNNAANKKQLERLLALNQLLNIAEYYNKRHLKEEEFMYYISLEGRNSEYFVQKSMRPKIERGLIPEFNREEDARAVINNPNFKEILDLVYKGDEN